MRVHQLRSYHRSEWLPTLSKELALPIGRSSWPSRETPPMRQREVLSELNAFLPCYLFVEAAPARAPQLGRLKVVTSTRSGSVGLCTWCRGAKGSSFQVPTQIFIMDRSETNTRPSNGKTPKLKRVLYRSESQVGVHVTLTGLCSYIAYMSLLPQHAHGASTG
ncbi:hypothetical protein BGW80DRAFT_883586 [Lactifluus volemus]|nr:hypothetical protein BGW80DRAFT_883586 [Lactifluus volemus]